MNPRFDTFDTLADSAYFEILRTVPVKVHLPPHIVVVWGTQDILWTDFPDLDRDAWEGEW